MLQQKLKNHNIILASGSPRRHQFFNELGIPFTSDVRKIEETYPHTLKREEITDYLSQQKASMFQDLSKNEILITSDTIVWKGGKAMEKPKNAAHAKKMLAHLSGQFHEVITSVCFTGAAFQKTVNETTKVWFSELSEEEIDHYVDTYQPFDKAGAYGIQEWIGYIGVEKIEGSFFNVVGLPTRLVYKTLLELVSK
ncbi:Maf family nucleotide pyrophosphatase [Marixanthomonas spongiae]|uniref:dTTP/UTP pyrophosphatase n=1 Tax=Marixanthomonas spongiae TaxID=2174845 RepID=A0A2U0HYR9_9FLAO|nr:Maf family nucleotide pyrophosphatase [Marixanthomonas spongiae]PVW13890.1 septum formation protein Maf [Marixanthomonas spongiae]